MLDGIEILFILLLIIIICNKYLYSYNIKLINKLVLKIPTKYLPIKIQNKINNININKLQEFNNKFYNIMFVIILIILLLVKLLHFYYSSEVYNNIDDFILVYNHIKKSNLLILVLPLLQNKNKNKILNRIIQIPQNYRQFNSGSINNLTKTGYKLNNNNLLDSSATDIVSSTSHLINKGKDDLINTSSNKGSVQINIKNISNYIINRNNIDKDVLEKFDNEVQKYISFVILVKVLIPKYVLKDLLKNIKEILVSVGISKTSS